MKYGRDPTELRAELDRQRNSRRDLIVNHAAMQMAPSGRLVLGGGDHPMLLGMKQDTKRQLGQVLSIPATFYDRLEEKHPDMLSQVVNRLLTEDPDKKRMVRILDHNARALLSSSYRCLDNLDMMDAALPVIQEQGAEIRSCEVTDRRLYLKAVLPTMRAEIPPPGVKDWEWGKDHHAIDVVEAGIELRNSETGFGSIMVSPGIHTVRCSNLAVFQNDKMRRTHLGRDQELGELMSDTSRQLEDAAIWSKLRDYVLAALDGRLFDKYVAELRAARQEKLPTDVKVEPLIQEVVTHVGLAKEHVPTVVNHFIDGSDRTRYGVHAAITRTAEELESYDLAGEFEHAGAKVIELKPTEWTRILDKAA